MDLVAVINGLSQLNLLFDGSIDVSMPLAPFRSAFAAKLDRSNSTISFPLKSSYDSRKYWLILVLSLSYQSIYWMNSFNLSIWSRVNRLFSWLLFQPWIMFGWWFATLFLKKCPNNFVTCKINNNVRHMCSVFLLSWS